MKKLLGSAFLAFCALSLCAQEYNKIPVSWKWISKTEAVFTYDGSFNDEKSFSIFAPSNKLIPGTKAPARYEAFPYKPDDAVNICYSPDSTKLAFTRENDLYVYDIAAGKETRLTYDGSELILNGYASWVYYEEILGRPSNYKAFWWSPDSKKIGFYRFDNSEVQMFPIYSPKNQHGSLNQTRYPKAGDKNPEVRIGIVDISALPVSAGRKDVTGQTVWADFNPKDDQYFGIPFWSPDGNSFYIAREPRIQNTLDLYAVSVGDGSKTHIYHEEYKTWLDWIEEVVFTDKGLYMARSFETGWEQIYFLSYDGKEFKRLTDGPNWRVSIQKVDEKNKEVYFLANRDVSTRSCLYKASSDGKVTALTNPELNVNSVSFSPDGSYFVASLSNYTTPVQVWLYRTSNAEKAWKARKKVSAAPSGASAHTSAALSAYLVADMKGPEYDASRYALPQSVVIKAEDGQDMEGSITYPLNFDPAKKYPVHVNIYGGPNTAYVKDRWKTPDASSQWWSENGIINVTIDSRAAGHNGRAGTDLVYRNLTDVPVRDFVRWAEYFRSLPYVEGDKIGVEGFSFGGTMTAMLLFRHSDLFHYGIAGGGVYDWTLYDSHYTERFMETPQTNPDGYRDACTLNYVKDYPVGYDSDESVMLKLTHGTGDDNVHFQNSLQLVDRLQNEGKMFELMIYPDGMHGYRGKQGAHSLGSDHSFWLKYLKSPAQ